jgi:hypothetical protein
VDDVIFRISHAISNMLLQLPFFPFPKIRQRRMNGFDAKPPLHTQAISRLVETGLTVVHISGSCSLEVGNPAEDKDDSQSGHCNRTLR